jgi:hypothetical protein
VILRRLVIRVPVRDAMSPGRLAGLSLKRSFVRHALPLPGAVSLGTRDGDTSCV